MDSLIKDERVLTAENLQGQPCAKILSLSEIVPFLSSPDSGVQLHIKDDQLSFTDGINSYSIIHGIPILYPANIAKAFLGEGLELKYYNDSMLQYFLLSQIKQRGEINAASSNVHYQRHLFRMKEFVSDCRGLVLDVGCDDVEISASLFNEDCSYIGLDPFSNSNSSFRVRGVGECLPVRDESIDNVVFNTSLDHILDYHQALEEARRVLKQGGVIIISTLAWSKRASLLNDAVHFHHFREYEILGALNGMNIESVLRYQYKDEQHRYALFVKATKPSY
jgi:SAM-dependent methyltransferase